MILPKNYVWWIQATLGKYIPAKILDIFDKKKTVMDECFRRISWEYVASYSVLSFSF